jgi:hypothetical protein
MENKKQLSEEDIDHLLYTVAYGVLDGTMKASDAKEINNSCGKSIMKGIGKLKAAIDLGIIKEIPALGITEMDLGSLPSKKIKELKEGNSFDDKCR